MRLKIPRASLHDARVLVAFNSAMALETEGKALLPTVIGAGVRGLLRRAGFGLPHRANGRRAISGRSRASTCGRRRAQATYRANGMARMRYLIYEQLKPGIR